MAFLFHARRQDKLALGVNEGVMHAMCMIPCYGLLFHPGSIRHAQRSPDPQDKVITEEWLE